MSEQPNMSVWDHIGELRKRLIRVLLLFVLAMSLGLYVAEYVINFLKVQPEAEPIQWIVIGLTDAFKVYFQFSLIFAIVITVPFALYQLWAFVSPGLTEKERRITLSLIPGAVVLFIVGLSFGYFWLFPFVVSFMTGISQKLGAQELYGMVQYFSFLFSIVIPFGFLFQLPIVLLFLTRLGILTPMFLRQIRKYAYFVLFVIAAIITPPDILSHLFVTVPLFILYEISIWLSQITYRKMQREREASE
jgi:sec-independent protein translocase protein TatC